MQHRRFILNEWHMLMSDTNTVLTHVLHSITSIFWNFYWCLCVTVIVAFNVCICVHNSVISYSTNGHFKSYSYSLFTYAVRLSFWRWKNVLPQKLTFWASLNHSERGYKCAFVKGNAQPNRHINDNSILLSAHSNRILNKHNKLFTINALNKNWSNYVTFVGWLQTMHPQNKSKPTLLTEGANSKYKRKIKTMDDLSCPIRRF